MNLQEIQHLMNLHLNIIVNKDKKIHEEIFIKALEPYKDNGSFLIDLQTESHFQFLELTKYVSDRLKNDQDFILSILSQCGNIKYINTSLLDDKAFILKVLEKNTYSYEFISERLKNDSEVLNLALNDNAIAYKYASQSLKESKHFLLQALRHDAHILQYAPKVLQDDKTIVLMAVYQNGFAIQFASESLKKDKEVYLAAIAQNHLSIRYLNNPEIWQDYDLILSFLGKSHNVFQHMPVKTRKDRFLIEKLVQYNGNLLKYASEDLKNDETIVNIALKNNSKAVKYMGKVLKNQIGSQDPLSYFSAYFLNQKLLDMTNTCTKESKKIKL